MIETPTVELVSRRHSKIKRGLRFLIVWHQFSGAGVFALFAEPVLVLDRPCAAWRVMLIAIKSENWKPKSTPAISVIMWQNIRPPDGSIAISNGKSMKTTQCKTIHPILLHRIAQFQATNYVYPGKCLHIRKVQRMSREHFKSHRTSYVWLIFSTYCFYQPFNLAFVCFALNICSGHVRCVVSPSYRSLSLLFFFLLLTKCHLRYIYIFFNLFFPFFSSSRFVNFLHILVNDHRPANRLCVCFFNV